MTLSAEQVNALSDAEFGQHVDLLLTDASLVRHNMMHRIGYAPYCGQDHCMGRCPFDAKVGQFVCIRCHWQTSIDPEFIAAFVRQQAILKARAAAKVIITTLCEHGLRELDAEESEVLRATVMREAANEVIDYSTPAVKKTDDAVLNLLNNFRPDIHFTPHCRMFLIYMAHGNLSRIGMLLFTAVKKCGLTHITLSDLITKCFSTGIPTEAAYASMWKATNLPSGNILNNKENWT